MTDILDMCEGFKPKKTVVTFINDKGKVNAPQKCTACGLEVHGWIDIFKDNRLVASLCEGCAKIYEKKQGVLVKC